jgi:hypothetical protein
MGVAARHTMPAWNGHCITELYQLISAYAMQFPGSHGRFYTCYLVRQRDCPVKTIHSKALFISLY